MLQNAFHHALSNIRSNRQVCLATVGSIAVALSLLGLFLFIYVNLNTLLSSWSREVQLIVYLKDSITADQQKELEQFFQAEQQVETVTFVSREEAWNNFQKLFSEKTGFMEDLDFNPLPASYNLNILEGPGRVDYIRELAEKVHGRPGVESVDYGERWVSRFETFLIFMRIFLLALGAVLALGILFIVSNTIKLSVYSRQQEIELMVLIGATPRFIKLPFFLEGIFQGLIGALLALGIIKILHWYLGFQFEGSLEQITRGIQFQFLSPGYVLMILVASVLVGWMGSSLTVNQYLKTFER